MCGGPTRGVAQLPSVITPEALLLGTQGGVLEVEKTQSGLGTKVARKEPRHGSPFLVGRPWASHFSLSLSYIICKVEKKTPSKGTENTVS